jgi:sulfate permease, SulP family
VKVAKYSLSGVNYHSNVDRAAEQQRVIAAQGEKLHILKLQGFIFFGTANNLLTMVRSRIDNALLPPVRFVVLDFSHVSGLDSSGINSFTKMLQIAEERRITLVLASLAVDILHQFETGSFTEKTSPNLRVFPDLDHGVEWCENQVLSEAQSSSSGKTHSLTVLLGDILPAAIDISRFNRHLEYTKIPKGSFLMRQGDPPQALYFIESGLVTAQLEIGDGKSIRLRTMGAGTVVGELGLYLNRNATASVVAEEDTAICRLSMQALRDMEHDDPLVAAAFHKFIVRLLGERLTNANMSLQALLS